MNLQNIFTSLKTEIELIFSFLSEMEELRRKIKLALVTRLLKRIPVQA